MDVATLERQLKEAKDRERKEGDAAWQALSEQVKSMVVWSVTWLDKYRMAVGVDYTPEALDLIKDLDQKYLSSYRRIHEDARRWRGMTYMLVDRVLIQSGGGWCVLKVDRRDFRNWSELTEAQAQAFRDGKVPDELKAM